MTEEQIEELGQIADTVDNLAGAMQLGMPAQFHLDQLKVLLPQVADRIKKLVVDISGDNPWE